MTPTLMTSMDISCKAQNSNITPKKDAETVMSPIDPITSQDYYFQMDLQLTNESSISESNGIETSNVETKFSPTETKKVISKNTAVLSTNSHDTNISN